MGSWLDIGFIYDAYLTLKINYFIRLFMANTFEVIFVT